MPETVKTVSGAHKLLANSKTLISSQQKGESNEIQNDRLHNPDNRSVPVVRLHKQSGHGEVSTGR